MDLDQSYQKWYCTRVIYVSETSAVAVDHSVESHRVEVTLARLKDGKMPRVQVFVTEKPFDETLLDNIVEARAPDRPRWNNIPGTTSEEQLSFWADTLRLVAPDFLEGNLSAIEDGERAVRDRIGDPNYVSPTERAIQEITEKIEREREGG